MARQMIFCPAIGYSISSLNCRLILLFVEEWIICLLLAYYTIIIKNRQAYFAVNKRRM